MRIAILFHERDRSRDLQRYDIMHIAKYWQQDGHQVLSVFGTGEFIPANIAILHVDLSIVPQDFVDFANRYPICLNKNALDIRKSFISKQLLHLGDNYQGPVIIKSNNNTAGIPERINGGLLSRMGLQLQQLSQKLQHQMIIQQPSDYRILEHLTDVPPEVFSRQDLVVEKFFPEREGDLYCTRAYLFLGTGGSCQMTVSANPIVSVGNCIRLVECDIHPKVLEWRQQLGFDYGKFDYVIHDGQFILLDSNKTTGSGDLTGNSMIERFRKIRADGLLNYYQQVLADKTRA